MKITSYEVLGKLPDLFTFDNGQKVTCIDDWSKRRKELMKTVVTLQYGHFPPEPEFLEVEPLTLPEIVGRMNIIRIHTGTRSHPVSFTVYAHIPEGPRPWPVVIDGDLCYASMQDPAIAEKFVRRGILLAAFNRCELAPDLRNPSHTGNLYETYSQADFGALAAWAWGFSRTVDALQQMGYADMSCVTFTGLSRGGKAALLAGAMDERATIVNPEGSGAGGTGCYRIHMKALHEDGTEARSETLRDIYTRFPDWFAPGMADYLDREAELPFDQHFLKALIAPRVLFDSEALSDVWAGPVNTYQTSLAALEVWKMYGRPENLLWYWRSGGHAHLPEDFDMLIEVIQRERCGEALQSDKFMKLPFDPPEKIFDWQCPEVK